MADGRIQVQGAWAFEKAKNPTLRAMSDAEVQLFGEAIDAGAVIVGHKLRDYLAGESALPVQWEGGHVFAEDFGKPWIEGPAATARTRRDAFLARVRSGDLRALADRIAAERDPQAKAAA
jgi:hypothetical protein